jgi:Transmembrane secretion effector
VLASLNVSAQVSLPDWVRGRGLAVFVTVFSGTLSLGSAVWGQLAAVAGLPATLLLAATGAFVAIPLVWRWKLQTGAGLDLSPSMHWAPPTPTFDVQADRGPVLVTVEYQIRSSDRAQFLEAIAKLGDERRRDGAFRWGLFEDVSHTGRFVETFLLDSWIEHLRQHERVTKADRDLAEAVNRFQIDGSPKVTHLVAAPIR